MKIQGPGSGGRLEGLKQADLKERVEKKTLPQAESASVDVKVSTRAAELSRLRVAILESPEVREEIVAQARRDIAEANLDSVPNESIAEKLLLDHLTIFDRGR